MSGPLSYFLSWRERQQARQTHERLENEDDHEGDHPLQELDERSTSQEVGVANNSNDTNESIVVETVTEEEYSDEENQIGTEATADGEVSATPTATVSRRRRTVTLADLEEERELSRRRTSICVLLSSFILFRLWIQAIATHDFFLLVMCTIGTSWTARFVRHTREREEELDRLISEYAENPDGNTEVDPGDMRMMSFQAQLALAIMESQRQMMQGGFGNPDGHSNSSPGVSDDARQRWERFQFKAKTFDKQLDGGYGAVGRDETDKSAEESDEEPHCSICLSEYEEGEELVRLPCNHVYHEDCVASWTSNHIRCPLCNFDLESVTEELQEP